MTVVLINLLFGHLALLRSRKMHQRIQQENKHASRGESSTDNSDETPVCQFKSFTLSFSQMPAVLVLSNVE